MRREEKTALVRGTLYLLILRTLALGLRHGQRIARSIQRESEDVFFVDHGPLYLALQRLGGEGLGEREMGRFGEQPQGLFFIRSHRKDAASSPGRPRYWRKVANAMARMLEAEGAEI